MRILICNERERLATIASPLFQFVDTIATFTLVNALYQTLVEMPARCFAKCALLSKTRPVQNFVPCWILLNPTTIRSLPSSSSTSCPRLLSRTAESLRRCVRVWRWKKGRKFHLAGKREEKIIPWAGEPETARRENRTVLGKFLDVITPPHIVREE